MPYWIIVHNSYRLELDGPSMRKIKPPKHATAGASDTAAADRKPSKGAKI